MLWECGNSFVFYFLMGYLPASETRGIALRGIIVMKYCVFFFRPYVYLSLHFGMALMWYADSMTQLLLYPACLLQIWLPI